MRLIRRTIDTDLYITVHGVSHGSKPLIGNTANALLFRSYKMGEFLLLPVNRIHFFVSWMNIRIFDCS
jgi:hypothetical protein